MEIMEQTNVCRWTKKPLINIAYI